MESHIKQYDVPNPNRHVKLRSNSYFDGNKAFYITLNSAQPQQNTSPQKQYMALNKTREEKIIEKKNQTMKKIPIQFIEKASIAIQVSRQNLSPSLKKARKYIQSPKKDQTAKQNQQILEQLPIKQLYRRVKNRRQDSFDLQGLGQTQIPVYQSYKDPFMKEFFSNDLNRQNLIQKKLVTDSGYVIKDKYNKVNPSENYNFYLQRKVIKEQKRRKVNSNKTCYVID